MTDSSGKSLLLVEDNTDDLELALRAFKLNNLPHDVQIARDGSEALDRLLGRTGSAPLPTVVLLDLNLPKVDGLTVLKRLRADARTALLPVVILTSSSEQVDLVASYRNGANSFVRKPVSFGDFVVTMRRIAGYWLSLNQTPEPGDTSTN
ncbi:MAG TPA: response regulator [Vicinamibacterales bacterium]|nr:response regulator [Vicinamibacterales bacterium]